MEQEEFNPADVHSIQGQRIENNEKYQIITAFSGVIPAIQRNILPLSAQGVAATFAM